MASDSNNNNDNNDDGGVAGSFFNPIPDGDDIDNDNNKPDFDESISELIRQRMSPSLASQPSTIGGVPTSQAKGFAKSNKSGNISSKKPYVGIGPPDETSATRPLNDITKPEYDDQGYTLYADEQTGQRSRVFEALVEYPCEFTLKIVGANEGDFVQDMVQIVAESCAEHATEISFSTRAMGKWTSVTVQAPVKSAEMLYMLYENVDRDPRVKFKF